MGCSATQKGQTLVTEHPAWNGRSFCCSQIPLLSGPIHVCMERAVLLAFGGQRLVIPCHPPISCASMLPATDTGAPTSPTCPSGALASASAVAFTPFSETVLSTAEAVVCEVSGQAKEVLKENATDSMAKPKALASLGFIAVTPLLHGRVAAMDAASWVTIIPLGEKASSETAHPPHLHREQGWLKNCCDTRNTSPEMP